MLDPRAIQRVITIRQSARAATDGLVARRLRELGVDLLETVHRPRGEREIDSDYRFSAGDMGGVFHVLRALEGLRGVAACALRRPGSGMFPSVRPEGVA